MAGILVALFLFVMHGLRVAPLGDEIYPIAFVLS